MIFWRVKIKIEAVKGKSTKKQLKVGLSDSKGTQKGTKISGEGNSKRGKIMPGRFTYKLFC